MQKDYKYVATVDLTDFNYTFTFTKTGFEVAENDDKGQSMSSTSLPPLSIGSTGAIRLLRLKVSVFFVRIEAGAITVVTTSVTNDP